jgi:ABC-type nitrate/sulfonate/bicarbonate transport system permease component
MTAVPPPTRAATIHLPRLVGLGSIILFLLAIEGIIRIGWISRFIVPPPSEIIASFGSLFFN